MADQIENVRGERRDPSDGVVDEIRKLRDRAEKSAGGRSKAAKWLDSEAAQREHKRLLGWYHAELIEQADNRLQMALDADCYDGEQWEPEAAQSLRDRGQVPLVFNQVAPTIDWVIGTERRNRVDWKILARNADGVQLADVKTEVLKYLSDVNNAPFQRSMAAADCFKVGVGWLDDGARQDPTKEAIYSRYEDWRNVIWDSRSIQPDLSDARYLFRWRWVDLDIALATWPERADMLRRQAVDATSLVDELESWYLGENLGSTGQLRESAYSAQYSSTSYAHGAIGQNVRERVKIIEAQYRIPAKVQIIASGPLSGSLYDPNHPTMRDMAQAGDLTLDETTMLLTHVAIMTEDGLIEWGPSPYRHNGFSLTPIWCYRRGRDRLPYGIVRRVRDIQEDLNKRASKALHYLNSNQVIVDKGAVSDLEELADEVSRPDGIIIKTRPDSFLEIRRDSEAASGQEKMMGMDAQHIQSCAGVTDENMGRQTNATSGEAIKARQLQGSVVTTEPFDNIRFATQIQGAKQLSLAEQFLTEQRVLRITGQHGSIEWKPVNQPIVGPDGTVRILNDITASQADFVVTEQDYSGTLRQVMFDSLNQVAQRLPPELAVKLLRMAYEYSDLPNKDDIVREIRKLTGEPDPNAQPTPEQQQQMQAQAQAQQQAQAMQQQMAAITMQEAQAKVQEILAHAEQLRAQAAHYGAETQGDQQRLSQVQQAATGTLDDVSTKLVAEHHKTMQDVQARRDVASIQAASQERIAKIKAESDQRLQRLERVVGAIADKIGVSPDAQQEQGLPDPNQPTPAKPGIPTGA